MKAIVIGDIHVDTSFFAEQVRQLPWKEPVEIVQLNWYPETKESFQEIAQTIEKNGPEGQVIPDNLLEEARDADAIFTHFCPLPKAVIDHADQLKLIATCRGGIEHVSEQATSRNIPVVNVIRNAEPVADFTLGLILAETRNIARSHHDIRMGNWHKNFSNSHATGLLRDLTVGVIGFGHIGRLVATKLINLGVSVMVYDPHVSEDEILAENLLIEPSSLEQIYKEADVLSIHLRFDKDQAPLIDRRAFQQMKTTSILVNTSRSYAIDEQALIEALTTDRIGGAALDVFWTEPIPLRHPLLELENVTLTAHLAGDTVQAVPKSPVLLMEKLRTIHECQSFSFLKN